MKPFPSSRLTILQFSLIAWLSAMLPAAFAQSPSLGVGGVVWNDLNADGIRQAGEPGIPNVTVQVFLDDGDGIFQAPDVGMGGIATDANGYYRLNGLPPGQYWVFLGSDDFFAINNSLFGFVNSPGVVAADSDIPNDDSGQDQSEPQVYGIVSTLVTLTVGGEPDVAVDGDGPDINSTVDFGFYRPPNPPIQGIGGTVWNDLYGDGIRQAGEPTIPGVYLVAYRDDGDGIFQLQQDTYVGSGATDANGYYVISSLRPGKYWVHLRGDDFNSLNALNGLVSSPGVDAADNDIPNDDNGVDDPQPLSNGIVSTLVTLSIGGEPDVAVDGDGPNINSTVDFGFTNPQPPPVVISVADVSIAEGNSGNTLLQLTVNLSAPSRRFIVVTYATADGTATTADNDYLSAQSLLVFPPNVTSRTIALTIKGDTTIEPDENFTLTLSNPTAGAIIGNGVATIAILNDDVVTPPPLVIMCPVDITTSNDPGQCSTIVNYPTPTTSGGSGNVTVVCNPSNGSSFPPGTNLVNCVATDAAGNTAACSFNIVVKDTEPPVSSMVATAPPVRYQNPARVVNRVQLFATDNCDPDPLIYIGGSLSPGFVAGPFHRGDNIILLRGLNLTPGSRKPRNHNIAAEITLNGDALIWATDSAGNFSAKTR